MIIGITGTLGAGKTTIVEILKDKGFSHHSVRSYLTRILKEQGKELSRDNMVMLANELRAENSPSFFAEELYKEAKETGGNAIIESIRTSGEIEALEKLGNFCLLAIDADSKTRYERVFKRGSSTDDVTYEKFMEDELKEMTSSDPNKQNISKCIEQADYLIQNDGEIETLKEAILSEKDGLLSLLSKKRRPTFNEQFMRQSYEWGERSTCLRRHVGAVLVKNNVILSQGYNGPARGSPHCADLGGCLREKLNIPSGQRDEICRAIHAEPNAILNCESKEARIGSILFCTTQPCSICAKLIANSGIKEVVYLGSYPSEIATGFLKDANVKITKYTGVTPKGYVKFFG